MSAQTGGRVLVVDDEDDVRMLVSRVLADTGHEVDVAENGAVALQRLDAARPDVIVLDLMMPVLDGWGVMRALADRKDAPPVVLLTARGDDESHARGLRAGAAAYLTKPFRFHELLSTVDGVIAAAGRPSAMTTERRRDPRRVMMVDVQVLSRRGVPLAVGEGVDLSASGLQIHLAVPLDVGTQVALALHVPGSSATVRLEGGVQWTVPVPRGHAHGVAFASPPPEVVAAVQELISRS